MEHQCQKHIYDGGSFRGYSCSRKGKVERNGRWYCNQHDPVAVAERDKRKNEEWERQWEEKKVRRAEQEAQRIDNERKLAAFPALVEACNLALGEAPWCPLGEDVKAKLKAALRAALAKDEGQIHS